MWEELDEYEEQLIEGADYPAEEDIYGKEFRKRRMTDEFIL